MEVLEETIKPFSSSHVDHHKPFNLCLLDQLTPNSYTPIILFFNNYTKTTHQIIPQLKCSLSKTLDLFYPLSGRVKNNIVIHEFNAGVPFFEARVKGHYLSGFLQHPRMEMLNGFLPYPNFHGQHDPTIPILGVKVNVFDCGGIAFGICFSHKIMDGVTFSSFLKTWAAISNGSYENLIEQVHPDNLFEASSMLPPRKSLPSRYTSMIHNRWFGENVCKARRFVFDANAVSALREKGRSEFVENPTRVEAISAFIWKYIMKALRNISRSPRPSVLAHAVDLRRRVTDQPQMSIYSIGNLILQANARYDEPDEMEMKQLVGLVKESIGKINSEYIKTMIGDHEAVLRHLNLEIEEVSTMENEDPYVFIFSSWTSFGFNEIDFGWGKPVWVGLFGEVTNATIFPIFLNNLGRKNNGSIEAWIALDESIMIFLEHDPEFLSFASLNPSIITMEPPNKDT